MIEIQNLTFTISEKFIIDNLVLNLEPAKIHGLIGLNGSGKTTLLNLIYGFLKPASGSIKLYGQPLRKTSVAFLETVNYFYPGITGKEYLQLFAGKNSEFDHNVGFDLLHLPLDELIEKYSVGMKKKLALLGVLKLNKPILILDEPFNGIDIETSKIIEFLILRLKEKGKTIIITSHIIETLTNTCDLIYILSSGKITKHYHRGNFTEINNDIFPNFRFKVDSIIDQNF